MAQYKIDTLYTTKGRRVYYVESDNADNAVKSFNKEMIKNNQVEDRVYMMTEDVKSVIAIKEDERVDIDQLKDAKYEQWKEEMSMILTNSRHKLRDEMGYGVPDEAENLKS